MTKPRAFSAQFKAMTVLALVSGEKTSGELRRENETKPQSFYQGRDQLLSDAHLAFEHSAVQESVEGQIAELERKVGRLTMEFLISRLSPYITAYLPGSSRASRKISNHPSDQ